MANKITRMIRHTTIYYKTYGEEDKDIGIIKIPGTLSDGAMWKAVKKLAGPKGVVWDYSYDEGKYSMDIDTFVNNAVKEDE